jgi:hypothetical protein
MIQPATSGIAIPDGHGAKARGWLIAYYITGSLFAAAAIANLIVYVSSLSTRAFGPVFICMGLLLLFGILSLICALTWSSYNASTRRELADARARVGHHGVDAKRLLQTKRPLVATPAGVLLQLRHERDDHGRQWILVDAFPTAGIPLAPRSQ